MSRFVVFSPDLSMAASYPDLECLGTQVCGPVSHSDTEGACGTGGTAGSGDNPEDGDQGKGNGDEEPSMGGQEEDDPDDGEEGDSDEEEMDLVVKTPFGDTIVLKVDDGYSVKKVKGMIKELEGIPRREQKLIFKTDQLEHDRTLRSYSIHDRDELVLLLRLGGGGKRGRIPGVKDDHNITKYERIEMKKQELSVIMLQLKELNHNTTLHIMNHIDQSLAQGDRVIDGALPHLPFATLQQIRSEINGNNDVACWCQSLVKFLFAQDMATITSANSAVR